MAYIANSFSINMLGDDVEKANLIVEKIDKAEVPKDLMSAIGHKETAAIVSEMLGWEVKPNRVNVSLNLGDVLYVAQYRGPRLEEGTTNLPEGAKLLFYKVEVFPL